MTRRWLGAWTLVAASLVTLSAQVIRVTIDIKPGDDGPKTLEPGRGGMVPVAVLTTPAFDAASVDPDSVRVGPTGMEAFVFKSALEDVDRDEDVDRLLLLRMNDLGLKCGHAELRLTGKTTSGTAVEGAQKVTMVGCP